MTPKETPILAAQAPVEALVVQEEIKIVKAEAEVPTSFDFNFSE